MAEIKSHHGNTFPFDALIQKERLKSIQVKGVHPIVVVWFVDHDKVVAFPIESIVKMEEDGLKSINVKTYAQYEHIDIPSKKKITFMDSDYKCVFEYFQKETCIEFHK